MLNVNCVAFECNEDWMWECQIIFIVGNFLYLFSNGIFSYLFSSNYGFFNSLSSTKTKRSLGEIIQIFCNLWSKRAKIIYLVWSRYAHSPSTILLPNTTNINLKSPESSMNSIKKTPILAYVQKIGTKYYDYFE